jgi:glycosyltransferase involved in cell wall biosynthesis
MPTADVMNVYLLSKKIPHHAAHSGYDQVLCHLPWRSLSPTGAKRIERTLEAIPEKVLKRWTWVGGWYQRSSLAKEIQVGLRLPFRKGIYHYLYGEDDFYWGGRLPFRTGSRIVVTYHQPPSLFDGLFDDKSFIAAADALIVCATNQIAYLEQFTGRENVHFVPHGVDTEYFTPAENIPRNGRFGTISVGWWLRDVEMIRRVIERSNAEGLDVDFTIVTFPEHFDHYRGLENVTLVSGITDEDLLRRYREASALLLPMKDCTANNAVLEAMACGVPVLTTDNGGMRDYVDDSCGVLVPAGDDSALFEALIRLKENSAQRAAMGAAARERALTFRWPEVARRMMDVYETIWYS